jgi:hypothetical protein
MSAVLGANHVATRSASPGVRAEPRSRRQPEMLVAPPEELSHARSLSSDVIDGALPLDG